MQCADICLLDLQVANKKMVKQYYAVYLMVYENGGYQLFHYLEVEIILNRILLHYSTIFTCTELPHKCTHKNPDYLCIWTQNLVGFS